MTVKEMTLTEQHQMVWSMLRMLPDGERLLGHQMRKAAGIKEERPFFKIIEDLREVGIFIGASRQTPKGYYEIRTDNDMYRFLNAKRAELTGEWEALERLEKKWIRKQLKKEDSA